MVPLGVPFGVLRGGHYVVVIGTNPTTIKNPDIMISGS